MANVPGLARRGDAYQFRVRVPDRLRPTVGKREIVKSFGRVSHAEAVRLCRIERTTAGRIFAEAELTLRAEPVASLSESELHHLSRAFFYRLERNASEVPIAPYEREELAEIAARDWTAVSNWDDDGVLHSATAEFARWAKVRAVVGTEDYDKVHNAVRLAHIEHYRREYERMAGRRIATPEPIF